MGDHFSGRRRPGPARRSFMTSRGGNTTFLSGSRRSRLLDGRRRRAWPAWVAALNVVGILILANVVIHPSSRCRHRSARSSPSRRAFLATFPYIWLPGFLVPFAFWLHAGSLVHSRDGRASNRLRLTRPLGGHRSCGIDSRCGPGACRPAHARPESPAAAVPSPFAFPSPPATASCLPGPTATCSRRGNSCRAPRNNGSGSRLTFRFQDARFWDEIAFDRDTGATAPRRRRQAHEDSIELRKTFTTASPAPS